MNEKFTPSPWICQDGDNFEKDTVITIESRIDSCIVPICEMDVYFDGDLGVEQAANAALIAAAPEMYAMLQKILEVYEMDTDDTNSVLRLLAHARGEV